MLRSNGTYNEASVKLGDMKFNSDEKDIILKPS